MTEGRSRSPESYRVPTPRTAYDPPHARGGVCPGLSRTRISTSYARRMEWLWFALGLVVGIVAMGVVGAVLLERLLRR